MVESSRSITKARSSISNAIVRFLLLKLETFSRAEIGIFALIYLNRTHDFVGVQLVVVVVRTGGSKGEAVTIALV